MTILDTNVVSEMMRPQPELVVLRWVQNQPSEELQVTTITIAEILYGVELLSAGKRRDALRAGAEKMFGVVFAERITVFDAKAARIYAVLLALRRRQGKPMSELDAQIAAIARANGAILATRNVDDFEGCGVRLVNPWES